MLSIFAYDYHCNHQGVKLKLHRVCTVVLNSYVCIPNIGLKMFNFFLYLIIIIVVLVIYYYYDYYYLIISKDALMDDHKLENIHAAIIVEFHGPKGLLVSKRVVVILLLIIIVRVELIYKLRNSSYCYFEISVTINIFSIERPVGLFWIKCLFQLMKWDISGFVSAFEKKRNIYIYLYKKGYSRKILYPALSLVLCVWCMW